MVGRTVIERMSPSGDLHVIISPEYLTRRPSRHDKVVVLGVEL